MDVLFLLLLLIFLFIVIKGSKQRQIKTIINDDPCPPHKWRPFIDNQYFEDKNIGDMEDRGRLRCMKCGGYPNVD